MSPRTLLPVLLVSTACAAEPPPTGKEPPNAFEAAFSMTMVAPMISVIATTDLSSDEKQLKLGRTREDALAFVASGGAIRGAHLEQALGLLRDGSASPDMAWAQALAAGR
ncbi:hypothetical protein PHLH8_32930 [Pseudomonas sp. Pc102]|uniref:DUF2388 domain-containing protein n=1 Tax=Pseudomonas sp. Pc102 TaxID=2678261 RepID=UPI001BCA968B|nr:DUF2388 domain-containing protein [Pseudomonas sp. Pc102]BBP83651.1 hypothetical protein PHLH8_32930 [Pseudomonas sp. Pc102]